MRLSSAGPLATIGIALALVATACGSTPGPSASASIPDPGTDAPATGAPVTAAPPTAVPGGQTIDPDPVPPRGGTTQTPWGEIADRLPASFPIHPDARLVEVPGEPVTAALAVPADADTVAAWYEGALADAGFAVELSQPLEDGSRVLDARSDLPECAIRMTFRPETGSAIITVLYGAGCVGLGD